MYGRRAECSGNTSVIMTDCRVDDGPRERNLEDKQPVQH